MIKGEGYIVTDDNGLIYGFGETESIAMNAALDTLKIAGIRLVPDDIDVASEQGSWLRAGDLRAVPASAALLVAVFHAGGNIAWGKVGGVACTRSEEDSALDPDTAP